MRFLLTFLSFLSVSGNYCQFYFNDIISTQQGNEQYKLLRTLKVKKITATSFEADNNITQGFLLEQEISMDGKKIILSTATTLGKSSVTNRTYDMGQIKKSQSNNNGIDNKTEYFYSDNGMLESILLTIMDTALKSTLIESHEWKYNEKGKPISMLQIKNKKDTLMVKMTTDEKGLVLEENWYKKNKVMETYYYYYDTKNQLTDIVKYYAKMKKLLPDFQYEYNAEGRVCQLIQISMSSSNYLIWKYSYTERGLKSKEIAYDKEKKMIGRIEYLYTY